MVCWGDDSLSRIGSLIGVLFVVDECTTKQVRVNFARILVEVNATRTVPEMVPIVLTDGRLVQ